MNIDRFRFRYWCNEHQEMTHKLSIDLVNYDVNYFCKDGSYPHILRDTYKLSDPDIHLMACTGLKDKNGQLLFEGDVFIHSDYGPFNIKWGEYYCEEGSTKLIGFDLDEYEHNIEIVGHIFMPEWEHMK